MHSNLGHKKINLSIGGWGSILESTYACNDITHVRVTHFLLDFCRHCSKLVVVAQAELLAILSSFVLTLALCFLNACLHIHETQPTFLLPTEEQPRE